MEVHSNDPIWEMMKTRHIKPMQVRDRDAIARDLLTLERSMTGRVDAWFANAFLFESIQMIANAISVFEQGYFDCAFYSLRQVIELSRTMIYLSDLNEDKKREEMRKWRAKARFPNQKQMSEYLSQNGNVFAGLKDALQEYFEEYEATNMRLNKYVHKQGYDTFYFGRSTSVLRNEEYEDLEPVFIECIVKCISAVAVNRLAIDPLPLLLADDDMFRRTGDLMSEAFSDEFIEKYLGSDLVERYKATEIYRAHYVHIAEEEPMNDAVLHVVKDQYVITSQIDDREPLITPFYPC